MTVAPILDDLAAQVEGLLRDIVGSRQKPLYRMMAYHLGWEDRQGDQVAAAPQPRHHGVACLTACKAVGGDVEAALPAAAAMELIDNFCQIHDDVQGGNPQREGRDSVWWAWGPAQAINAGDGMHTLARVAILQLRERGIPVATAFKALQMLDVASLDVCEGRFEDIEAQERIDLSTDNWLRMAARKTGALYSCAMRLGALIGLAEASAIEGFGTCGEKAGVAVQIRDDLEQMWGDGDGRSGPSPEVLNKKKLLPVVFAFEAAKLSEKRRLGDIYFKRVLGQEDVPALLEVLDDLGVREHCEALVKSYRSEALDAVAEAGVAPQGAAMMGEFVDSVL